MRDLEASKVACKANSECQSIECARSDDSNPQKCTLRYGRGCVCKREREREFVIESVGST